MDGDVTYISPCEEYTYQEALKSSAALSLRPELLPKTTPRTAVSTQLQPEGETQQLAGVLPPAMPVQSEHIQAA